MNKLNLKESLYELLDNEIDSENANINIEWLADYLIEHNVMMLPYKVGDMIYYVKEENNDYAVKLGKITQIIIGDNKIDGLVVQDRNANLCVIDYVSCYNTESEANHARKAILKYKSNCVDEILKEVQNDE